MYYLIDGNNLAGAMGLLEENDFNEILIDLIIEYLDENRKKVILIFDSNELMGDSYEEGRLRVIYSPRDEHYQSADDKIIELSQEMDPDEGLAVITNDNEIKEEISVLNKEQNRKNEIQLIDASEFMMELGEDSEDVLGSSDELEEEEVDEINDELAREWV
ncbi:hypothetical protein C0584_06005 [Candidatus Parcubacteria bacterium]|nr:MAG: hypothetical protein C0584_06005 [Candidatus Parcubacteria bacterium]